MNPRPDVTWYKVPERRYWDMLEVLPPAMMGGDGRFMVGEAWDHGPCAINGGEAYPRFSAFFVIGEDHYEAGSAMTRSEFKAMTMDDLRAAAAGAKEATNG